ncbi:SdpI family protein [Asticcacaulis sp. SL142]|uniref:SdpI family protein n=1 Tax=Asticcacaulis sp. SL142 TaxID=2995155 RepID=UPI00226D1264|nr:SdpI family protein [Asticcacaulis sp. SL142]WAC47435.1 SdpI family protein [Asticcacaulis sp. SL142]
MKSGFAIFFNVVVLGALVAVSLWAHSILPDVPIATHFNAAGMADGFQPRDIGLAIMPGTLLVIGLLLWVLPRLMPNQKTLERSSAAYAAVWITTVAVLAVAHGFIVSRALGIDMDVRLMLIAPGVVFIILGNFMPKMRQNRIMGIRTPWTLKNETVWDRTHRFSGIIFMMAGSIMIIANFILPPEQAGMAIFVCGIVPAFICVAYSFLVARQLKVRNLP